MEWLVTSAGEVDAVPYEVVGPYETVELAAWSVVQVMVAVVWVVEEAMAEITGAESAVVVTV
jgi:hypothetical protein